MFARPGRDPKRVDAHLARVRDELSRARPITAPPRPRRATRGAAAWRRGLAGWRGYGLTLPHRAVAAVGVLVVAVLAVAAARRGRHEHVAALARGAAAAPISATCPPAPNAPVAPADGLEEPLLPLTPAPERFVVEVVNTGKTVEVVLGGLAGEPDADSYRALRHELRSTSGAESPLDPRLIELLHQIAKHAHGSVQVLSAFRPPKTPHDHNYHSRGMAADVRVAGMGTIALRDLARSLGAAGVGYYPTSRFIHVDVRDGHYEWTDTSGPGKGADDVPASDTLQAASSPAPTAASSLEAALLGANAGSPGVLGDTPRGAGGERIARAGAPSVDPVLPGAPQAPQATLPAPE